MFEPEGYVGYLDDSDKNSSQASQLVHRLVKSDKSDKFLLHSGKLTYFWWKKSCYMGMAPSRYGIDTLATVGGSIFHYTEVFDSISICKFGDSDWWVELLSLSQQPPMRILRVCPDCRSIGYPPPNTVVFKSLILYFLVIQTKQTAVIRQQQLVIHQHCLIPCSY